LVQVPLNINFSSNEVSNVESLFVAGNNAVNVPATMDRLTRRIKALLNTEAPKFLISEDNGIYGELILVSKSADRIIETEGDDYFITNGCRLIKEQQLHFVVDANTRDIHLPNKFHHFSLFDDGLRDDQRAAKMYEKIQFMHRTDDQSYQAGTDYVGQFAPYTQSAINLFLNADISFQGRPENSPIRHLKRNNESIDLPNVKFDEKVVFMDISKEVSPVYLRQPALACIYMTGDHIEYSHYGKKGDDAYRLQQFNRTMTLRNWQGLPKDYIMNYEDPEDHFSAAKFIMNNVQAQYQDMKNFEFTPTGIRFDLSHIDYKK